METAAGGYRRARQIRAARRDGPGQRGRIGMDMQTPLAVHASSCVRR
jgi:hypothetical protein